MNLPRIEESIKKRNLETGKDKFGKCLLDARKRKKMTQSEIGEKIGLTRVVIANWEKGNSGPEPDKAIQLAKILDQDPAEIMLLSIIQKAASNNTINEDMIRIISNLLGTYEKDSFSGMRKPSLATHTSLIDFPEAFSPIIIIVGDKREEEPQNAGDLFVFSASPIDDRWLSSLRLPADTEKISDKVLMTCRDDKDWLKEKLGKRNILCIGSPASNLFAREFNDHFLFRFAISREALRNWENMRDKMFNLETAADLSVFYHRNKPDLKHIMRLFKPPGFIDFNYRNLRLGMDIGYSMDFAVISIGQNPYSEPADPFFSILVAGIHHPATANAVKFLANPNNFEKHPFGGILEVQVPSKEVSTKKISWHNKVEYCSIEWHRAGNYSLEYTPESLLTQLQEHWKKKVAQGDIITDAPISEIEIDSHIQLLKLLEKKGSIFNEEPILCPINSNNVSAKDNDP